MKKINIKSIINKAGFLTELIDELLIRLTTYNPWRERRVYIHRCGRIKSFLSFRQKKLPYVLISSAMNPTTVGWDIWIELINFDDLKIKTVNWKLYENLDFREPFVDDLFRPVYMHVEELCKNKISIKITLVDNKIIQKTIKI